VVPEHGLDRDAVEAERLAAESLHGSHLRVRHAACPADPTHRDRIAHDQRAGLLRDVRRVPEMLAVRMADEDGVHVLRHRLGRDAVRLPPGEQIDPRVEQDDGVAVRQLVVGDAEKAEDEDVGIERTRTAGRGGCERLARGLALEGRIRGLGVSSRHRAEEQSERRHRVGSEPLVGAHSDSDTLHQGV